MRTTTTVIFVYFGSGLAIMQKAPDSSRICAPCILSKLIRPTSVRPKVSHHTKLRDFSNFKKFFDLAKVSLGSEDKLALPELEPVTDLPTIWLPIIAAVVTVGATFTKYSMAGSPFKESWSSLGVIKKQSCDPWL